MCSAVILLADNDPLFLHTRAEFLTRKGYQVIPVASVTEVESALEQFNIHLMILDIRLENDDNERDISGILLAQKASLRNIPKLILTGYPDPYTSRASLKPLPEGWHPAINYIGKEEGPEALLQAVNEALATHVKINWYLSIEWKALDSLSLLRKIQPDLSSQRLLSRADEIEDLFRRLFFHNKHLIIERLLWEREGRVALVVFAFKEGARTESFVVVCGKNDLINQEAQRFDEFSPKAPGELSTTLPKEMRAETTHFAANAYALAGNDLEKVQTLSELYRLGTEKTFNTALATLYEQTLQAWHQGKLLRETQFALEELYQQRLNLTGLTPAALQKRIRVLEDELPRLGVSLQETDGKIVFVFNPHEKVSFPDPVASLSHILEARHMAFTSITPGALSGENVIVDSQGHAWLTDFAEAGPAPFLWNYVSLEASMRFNWVEGNNLFRLYELEKALIYSDFARPDVSDLEMPLRKLARAILTLRKLAVRAAERDVYHYHLGIFFFALRYLMDFDLSRPHLLDKDLVRLGHLLLSLTMLCGKLEKLREEHPTSIEETPLRLVNETTRQIQIGNRVIRLPEQPFQVFLYLYRHANQTCTFDEILQGALGGQYNRQYLHTLIGRIRRQLGEDGQHPRFLVTDTDIGYRLVIEKNT